MGKYLDKEGVERLWNETKNYTDNALKWKRLGDENIISLSDAKAADIVFETNDGKKIVKGDADLQRYKDKGWTPIGVVVIPASHDVYGTGEAAIMSLAAMDCNTPDTGAATESTIYWGQYNVNVFPSNKQYNYANTVTNATDNILDVPENRSILPSTNFTGTLSADSLAYYNQSFSFAPSPYLADGSRNPIYYQNSNLEGQSFANIEKNALADFDGIGNSQVLWEKATTQTDWKTTTNINNQYGSGYSPAACCCWRFHTEGTNQGDWYLPACGEFGYVIARLKEINSAIERVNTVYGSNVVACQLGTSNYLYFWLSSECDNNGAKVLGSNNGYVSSSNKKGLYHVRAFLRIGDRTL